MGCDGEVNRVSPLPFTARSVAQSGSASGLGPEGREFESLHSDHLIYPDIVEFLDRPRSLRARGCTRRYLAFFVVVALTILSPGLIPSLATMPALSSTTYFTALIESMMSRE